MTTLLDLLNAHDWTFEYSDMHAAWTNGFEQRKAIMDAIRTPKDLALALAFSPRVPEPLRAEYRAACEKALIRNLNLDAK